MRVLHVTRDFPPQHRGGLSTVVAGMAAASRRAGVDVAVCSFDDWRPRRGGEQRRGGVQEAGSVFRVGAATQIESAANWAGAFAPDLLHVHDGMLWFFAESLRRDLRAPVVGSVHVLQRQLNRLRGREEQTASLRGEEAMMRGADLVVAPSRSAADILVADYPDIATRLRVIPHGVGDSAAGADATTRSGRSGVLYVGRFADVKGTHDFLAAVPLVLAAVPDASFVLAGGVPGNRAAERRWRRRWEREAAPESRSRVAFTGWLSPRELRAQYAAAAVVAVPSHSETFGLAAAEAMLHRVPVVAAAAGALPELIENGRNGVLYEPGDVSALASGIAALLADGALAERIGAAAAKLVRAERSWESAMAGLREVYQRALTTRSRWKSPP